MKQVGVYSPLKCGIRTVFHLRSLSNVIRTVCFLQILPHVLSNDKTRHTEGFYFFGGSTRLYVTVCINVLLQIIRLTFFNRIVLPIKKFLLSEDQISQPIPTLSDRQFVVTKTNLSSAQENNQRELFWYREELFKIIRGHWLEASNFVFSSNSTYSGSGYTNSNVLLIGGRHSHRRSFPSTATDDASNA
jgi:hypothetical protein